MHPVLSLDSQVITDQDRHLDPLNPVQSSIIIECLTVDTPDIQDILDILQDEDILAIPLHAEGITNALSTSNL